MTTNDTSGTGDARRQALHTLDRLVGTWTIDGGSTGTSTYRWYEGDAFLAQDIDLTGEDGQPTRGVEYVGYDPETRTLRSHYFSGTGEILEYTYELSGDTLTGGHVDTIRERHPDVDVAVLHLGGTRVLFHTVTMDGEQGADFLGRLRPASAIPVHHDDYRVMKSPLSAFLTAAERAGLRGLVRPVGRGQTVELGTGY